MQEKNSEIEIQTHRSKIGSSNCSVTRSQKQMLAAPTVIRQRKHPRNQLNIIATDGRSFSDLLALQPFPSIA